MTILKNSIPSRRLSRRIGVPALLGLALLTGGAASADTAFMPQPESERFKLSVVGLDGVVPDTAPFAIVTSDLRYPPRALDIGKEGWLIVEMAIDEKGMPYNAEVVSSVGDPAFHRSALRAIKKFRFAPAMLDGKAVGVEGKRFKISFNLKNRPE